MSDADTIFALSSGQPPAAIAIVRISGAEALAAAGELTSAKLEPRRPRVVALRADGDLLDNALALFFPGPNSSTGEDTVEFHLHGGRAVVNAVLAALARNPKLRAAEAGEFTRRAFANGRIDLAEAEGLADLLSAETEAQRRSAMLLAGGSFSREVHEWTAELLRLAAGVEALLDFSDEGDVDEGLPAQWHADLARLESGIEAALRRPSAERLRDGIRVVLAGPPNAGKSTLFNRLVGREAAITHEIAGTTRDLIEAPVAIGGLPFLMIDTAGLRSSADAVETIGVDRARAALDAADLVLWLGSPGDAPRHHDVIRVRSRCDELAIDSTADFNVSGRTGEGVDALVGNMLSRARDTLPVAGEAALHARHRDALQDAASALREANASDDLLIIAESLRLARAALDRITGRAGVEDMLDTLFGRFCIGK
ncbi:MAG: tRNA uridine-5-carboxymethylaminomethyl(34) synthesis GTPase MnmE [Allosphingosinicella sp.]|uniref:tRNA uridine-5-carboxymethylaminomethyl(34) synthesis GTPase MnmE n=1 Tax=Allosphingosinicella sp. TaxID=2823234 RepID=UPI003944DD8A